MGIGQNYRLSRKKNGIWPDCGLNKKNEELILKKKKKKKKVAPPLPSEHQGWNAGKGNCGHYRRHLGFSVLMGRGFIEVGGWSREEPEEPLSHFFPGTLRGVSNPVFPPPA